MIYLLNLKRRPDRLTSAMDQCAKAGFKPRVWEAVDGRRMPLPEGWKAGSGAYGCWLSHRAILTDALKRGHQEITVFEDDVVLVDDFQNKYREFRKHLPADWQGLFLGGQHIHPPLKVNDHVLRAQNVHRTHAYVIRGDYIKTLLDLWTTVNNNHVDHTWGDHQKDVNLYCPVVWLAGQGQSRSDINGRELGERFWKARQIITPKSPNLSTPKKPCNCGRPTRPLTGPNRRHRR